MDTTPHPQLPPPAPIAQPPMPIEQPRREPSWQKAVGIIIGICAIVGAIAGITAADDDNSTTRTTHQADEASPDSMHAVFEATWGHMSVSEQAQMCDGINEFGLDFAWTFFSDGVNDAPITRDAFDRFFTGVC